MKKCKKLGALLLCWACLLSVLPLPASAAGLSLTYRQTAQGAVVLGLSGLESGKTIYGVQLEVTLAGSYEASQVSLTPADPLAYSPGHAAAVTHSQGQTTLTVYLASPLALNSGSALTLGGLSANGMGVIPERAKVALLDSQDIAGGVENLSLAEVPVVQSTDSESPDLPFGESHPITSPQAPHGSYQVLPAARENQVVTVYVQPEAGYKLGSLLVTDSKGQPVAILDMGSGQYTFRMPGSAVKLEAIFVTAGNVYLPFTDVKEKDWFYASVQYVYDRGMMQGMDETHFSPGVATSRAMIVTILHRLEGSPAADSSKFTDVPAGQWYTQPVAWAAANKLVEGYGDGRFGPTHIITREQFVTILHRYAVMKGYDVSDWADLSRFPDIQKLASFAESPMHWAVGCGLINGMDDGTLAPKGSATRAQAAAILTRFCERNGM